MKSSQLLPQKIQINSARKSMIGRDSLINSNTQQITPFKSQVLSPPSNNREKELQDKNDKLIKQVAYYREKHDESLIKVRFLIDKLKSVGAGDKVPNDVQT